MEKLTFCASCGADIEPRSGPGRPSVYCSDPCRRMAEFRIRGLVRRLDKSEVELRALKVGGGFLDDDDRRRRMRALRRWIALDTARLRAFLGGKDSKDAGKNQDSSETAAPIQQME